MAEYETKLTEVDEIKVAKALSLPPSLPPLRLRTSRELSASSNTLSSSLIPLEGLDLPERGYPSSRIHSAEKPSSSLVTSASSPALAVGQDLTNLTVKELLELYSSKETQSRIAAASELAKRVPREDKDTFKQIINAIVQNLNTDSEMIVRAASATAIGNINSYYTSVAGALQEVNSALIQTLYLSGKDSELARKAALQSIEKLRIEAAIPDIATLLTRDSDSDVRVVAGRTLGVICGYFNSSFGSGQLFWRQLREKGAPSLEQALLNDPMPSVRSQAAESLQYIGHPKSVTTLIRALDDPDASVRSSACISLGNFFSFRNKPAIYDSPAANRLISIAANTSEDSYTRESAVYALRKLKPEEALPVLRTMAETDDKYLRLAAISALGEFKDRESIPIFKRMLDRPDASAGERMTSARGLAAVGDSYCLSFLVSFLADKANPVYQRVQDAADTLGKLGNEGAVGALISAYDELKDFDPYFKPRLLSAIVGAARNDATAKDTVAQKFGVTGKKLDIWNQFGVLVLEGTDKFTDDMLSRITKSLEPLSKDELKSVNIISSEVPQRSSAITLGVTLADADHYINTVYLRLNELRTRSDAEFSEVMTHELGHLIYPELTVKEQVKMDSRYWASADEVYGDMQKYFKNLEYFVSDYADYNIDEFFAETRLAYMKDSLALVKESKEKNRDQILQQVAALASIYSFRDEDGQLYTSIFKMAPDGTIIKGKALVSSSGLPTQ